jgi:hypothetical protein
VPIARCDEPGHPRIRRVRVEQAIVVDRDADKFLRVSTLPEVAGVDRGPARARLAVGAGLGLGLFITTEGRVTIPVQWLNAIGRNPPSAQADHLP